VRKGRHLGEGVAESKALERESGERGKTFG